MTDPVAVRPLLRLVAVLLVALTLRSAIAAVAPIRGERRAALGLTPAMAGLLMTYAKAHWHGVSTPADFRAAAQAASGTDLTSFRRSHAMG